MAESGLRSALQTLFSSNVVVHNVGGDQIKVVDTSGIQSTAQNYMGSGPNIHSGKSSGSGLMGGMSGMGQSGGAYADSLPRRRLYHDYELMDKDPIVSSALDFYASESVVEDDQGDVLTIETDHPQVNKILHNLYYEVLNIEFNLQSWIRDMCKYGDSFIRLYIDYESENQMGIYNCDVLSPYHVERIEGEDPSNPFEVKFAYDGPKGEDELGYWEVGHFSMRDSAYAPYGKCVVSETKVSTKYGEKDICKIEPGEQVWTYDKESGDFEIADVIEKESPGEKKILKIRTHHNFIRCSKNHPVLVVEDGKKSYKKAKNITEGDLIVHSEENCINESSEVKLNKTLDGFNKNGWKNNIDHIPDNPTDDWSKFFGFMLGDGWITRNAVYFADGEHPEKNKEYTNLLKKFSGKKPRKKAVGGRENAQTLVGSKMLCRVLKNNGFVSGAHQKRIPNWVFKLNEKKKRAFVEGLVDADGSTHKDKWGVIRYNVELCNKELIEDLKRLLQTINVKTGKIIHRCRMTEEINQEGEREFESWYFYFYLDGENVAQMKKYDVVDEENIIISPVKSIEHDGKEKVWDIQVSKNKNFVANGILVHNSRLESARNVYKRLTILEDAMMIHRIMRAPERRVFKLDVGNLQPGKIDSFMEKTKQELKSQPLVDPETGEYDLEFNLMNMMDDYFMPVRGRDDGTEISTLNSLNWQAIEDVEYLRQKMMSALRVPNAFLGYEAEVDGKNLLSQQSIKFGNTVSNIQKIVANELTKIGIVHLFSQGIRDDRLVDFSLGLTHPSHFLEQQKIDLLESKYQLVRTAEDQNLHSTEWLMQNVFNMNQEEIKKERIRKIEDWKREFVKEQLTREGNNPLKTGMSYGTPGDLAMSGASELQHFEEPPEEDVEAEDDEGYSFSPDSPFEKQSSSDFKTTSGDVTHSPQGGSPLAAGLAQAQKHHSNLIQESLEDPEGSVSAEEVLSESELDEQLRRFDWLREENVVQ